MSGRRYDRRVTVQLRTKVTQPSGQEKETWAEAFNRWMRKRDARASERYTADQLVAEIDTVFTGRYLQCLAIRPDTHRFVYLGRVYEILGRTELGRQDDLEFACAARGEASYGD
jgi:SPP1 family predicted phage head-tail adaptor